MFHLFHAVRHFNVWLDIQPKAGHRMVFQSYPGGIMSGLDYYMNERRIVVQRNDHQPDGFPFGRACRWPRLHSPRDAICRLDRQSSRDSVQVFNNGLYSNEWLLGDTKTNEVAMFELGTHKHKLWRSKQCRIPRRDLMDFIGVATTPKTSTSAWRPCPAPGRPSLANLVFRLPRIGTWYGSNSSNVTPAEKSTLTFGFEAFTTPPLAAVSLAGRQVHDHGAGPRSDDLGHVRSAAGPCLGPNERRTELARPWSAISNDWALLHVKPPSPGHAATNPRSIWCAFENHDHAAEPDRERPPAWRGTILPAPTPIPGLPPRFPTMNRSSLWNIARGKSQGSASFRAMIMTGSLALFEPPVAI